MVLAPHDVAVAIDLLGECPRTVTAQGRPYLREGVEDVAFRQMRFPSGQMAAIHVSWLDLTRSAPSPYRQPGDGGVRRHGTDGKCASTMRRESTRPSAYGEALCSATSSFRASAPRSR